MRVIGAIFAAAPALAMAAVAPRQDPNFEVTGSPTYVEVTVLACSTDGVHYTKRQDVEVTGTLTYSAVTITGCPTATVSGSVTLSSPSVTASDLTTLGTDGFYTVTSGDPYGATDLGSPTASVTGCQATASPSESDKVWVSGTAYTSLHFNSGILTATMVPFQTQTTTAANGDPTTVLRGQALAASPSAGAASNINAPMGLGGAAILGAALLAAML